MNYSPDIIRRYRQIDLENGFNRVITERTPIDPENDRLLLACGHTRKFEAWAIDTLSNKDSPAVRCPACAEEWLAVEKEKEDRK